MEWCDKAKVLIQELKGIVEHTYQYDSTKVILEETIELLEEKIND